MLMSPQETKKAGVRFLARISKSGGKLFINIPLEMHEQVESLKSKDLSVTLKEIRLE